MPVVPALKRSVPAGESITPFYKKGRKWTYFSTAPNSTLVSSSKLNAWDFRYIILLTVVSFAARIYALGEPSVVVFDEAHVVSHINKYIDGVYFNDVTPPLAGLFYTFVAYLAGYRGEAPLTKPGQDYLLTTFPFKTLRAVTSVLGSGICSIAFLTLRSSGVRPIVAFAVSLIFAFENMAVITNRLFMPDTLFMFGVALAVYSYKKFDLTEPFGKKWIKYLLMTGVSLGLTVSTKWIGLATVTWILALTGIKLWYILGDLDVTNCAVSKHSFSRLGAFVIAPAAIYFGIFAVHIMLLTQFHNDASLLSTAFQRELIGNDVHTIPKYVTWNSTITLRHSDSLGGYLHSHPYKYKSGSREQQVTVFNFKDFNNEWIIEPGVGARFDVNEPRIKQGQEVQLRHKNTGAVMRVDKFKPPMSEQDYDHEVACFGNSSYAGNETDKYQIKFKNEKESKDKFLTATDAEFRLYNSKKRCTVLSHDIKLPDWGFGQQEVICVDSPTLARTYFKVENVKYPKSLDLEKYPFLKEKVPHVEVPMWKKFLEVNNRMYRLLKGIKVTNKNASSGSSWPLLSKGVRFSTRPNSSLYVIGNPVTFIFPLVLIPVLVLLATVGFFRGDKLVQTFNYTNQSASYALGFLIHWLPYVLQDGEFFLQYYIPALYFGVLLAGVSLEYVMFKNSTLGNALCVIMVLASFHYFSAVLPVIWGTSWTEQACEAARLFPSWDMRCDTYK